METSVRQARHQKAAAIELKTDDKPAAEAEHTYFETEEYVVSCVACLIIIIILLWHHLYRHNQSKSAKSIHRIMEINQW